LQLHFSADEWWTEITASESVKVRHKVWLAKEAKRGIKDPFTPSDWATQTRPPAPVVTLTTGLDEVAQTTAAYVKATWTRPDWRHIDRYAVRIRRVGSDTYQYQETKELSVTFHGLISGVEYGVQVAVIDGRGVMGEPSPEVTITTPKDQTIPATPSGLTVVSHLRGVQASITPNTEPDLRHYIWEYRIGTSGSWQVLARDLVTSRVIPAEAGQTVQVRVSAEDWSGNVSSPSAVQSATAGRVTTHDWAPHAISDIQIYRDAGQIFTISASYTTLPGTNVSYEVNEPSTLLIVAFGPALGYPASQATFNLYSYPQCRLVVNDVVVDEDPRPPESSGVVEYAEDMIWASTPGTF